MKRFLLSFLFLFLVLFGNAQIVINEVYTSPGANKNEFFELYNTSVENIPASLDCYTLIIYYKTSATESGFFVLDLPNQTVNAKSFFTGASAASFNVQGQIGLTPNFTWSNIDANSGSLTKWRKNTTGPAGYTEVTGAFDYNDIFQSMHGGGDLAVFLFKDGGFVNGLIGGFNTTNVPADITAMIPLPVDMKGACSDFTVDWSSIIKSENVKATGGSDNGFARTNDGKCGAWIKTTSQATHTPGISNGSAADLNGSLTTSQVYNCSATSTGESNIKVNVTGATGDATASNTLPVEVQLYYDYGIRGQLDGSDIFKDSHTFTTFTEGEKTFTLSSENRGQPVIVVYKTTLGCFDKIVDLEPSCITLPVSFKSFSATRNKANVAIRWETAMEQNNRGFYVQRNIDGAWKNIAFVFSAATNGNSAEVLGYAYNDANNFKTVSQYRILQVDIDGKGKYTEIRSVKGEEQASKVMVFPNPSADKVNVLFEDGNSVKDVVVTDISGRVVKQYRSITANSLVIENLTDGFYTIQITDRHTAVNTVEKVVVKKR